MNEFVFNDTYTGGTVRQSGVGNEFQERDRRDRAIEVVSRNKFNLERLYTPLVAKEYLSLLFRQRGIPSVDMFTSEIIGSFRRSVGLDPEVKDTLRRIVTLGKWSNHNMTVTMWTIEPVVATTCIRGNSINVADAKKRFMEKIHVENALTMGTHEPSVANNEIKGRWAGWLTWMQYEAVGGGNPSCVSCNLCGPAIMFAIHRTGSTVFHMAMTPKSINTLANYSPSLYTMMGTTTSLIETTSTRLKIQPGLDRPRSTSLTVYGNGSMQFTGAPAEIPVLYPSLIELVKMTMNSEMVSFLSTMRRADVSTF